MAKKFNQNLLNEELKKFRLLSEYSFYTEEPKDNEDDLILGSGLGEADEEPVDPNAPAVPDAGDDSNTAANAAGVDPNAPVDPNAAPPQDVPADPTAQAAVPGPEPVAAPEENPFDTGAEGMEGGDEVEVDVTQLVQGSEEATNAANDASQKTSELLAKFSDLEQRVSSMGSLTSKIDALEKEIVKRNPTPVEKLEMRSMSSYPYNIKLTDYWSDVDGYDATGSEDEKEEYVLTKDDVDSGFTDASIKQTFDVPTDYEEEDI